MNAIESKRDELYRLCDKHQVDKLFVFGLVLTDRFNPQHSDIDFLVQLLPMPPLERGEALMALWSELEALFTRKIDLLTEQSLKNPYLIREIERTKRLIYNGKSQKILI